MAAAKRFCAIERGAGRYGTDKVAQAITWLNQERFSDYGEPVAGAGPVGFPVLPGTPEWRAWWRYHDGHRNAVGASFGQSMMTRADDTGQPYMAASQWPPDEQRDLVA